MVCIEHETETTFLLPIWSETMDCARDMDIEFETGHLSSSLHQSERTTTHQI